MASSFRLNLTFHGIGEPPADRAREVDYWLPREQLLLALDRARLRPDVAITFDDGNLSDVEVALPALLERGLKAHFFVCAGRLDQPGFLGADGVRALIAAGMTVGSHGMHHRRWPALTSRELIEETEGARLRLESVTRTPADTVAVPFGEYNRRVLAAVRRAGFARVFTSDQGWASAAAWLQPRNTLHRSQGPAAIDRLLDTREALPLRWMRGLKRTAKSWR
jgi:peptidoglycan/xylan/chitin deacetylase (PgdA/CDA1 family)